MVPKRRLELPRPYGHMILNHARLPIPPLRLVSFGGLHIIHCLTDFQGFNFGLETALNLVFVYEIIV